MPNIPEQVRRQAEEADRMLYGSGESTPSQNDDGGTNTPSAEATPAVEPQESATPSTPATPATPSDQEGTPEPEPKESDGDYWRRRFEVIEGKYNAEVPQLHARLSDANRQIDQLKQELDQLKQQPQESEPSKPSLDNSALEASLQELENTYGSEFVAPFRQQQEYLQQLVSQNQSLGQTLEQLRNQVQDVSQRHERNEEDDFFERLGTVVPDWQQLNRDQDFINWVQEVEPLSGTPKVDLLNRARQELDADRAAKFFQDYKRERGIGQEQRDQERQQQKRQQKQRDLEKKVAPGETRAGDTPKQAPVYTRDRISQIYRDHALGRMSDEEFAQHEQAIREAQEQGTIK